MRYSRRAVLRQLGAAGVALASAGIVTAENGAQYLVRTGRSGARQRLERAGFRVETELADGRVLVVVDEDAGDDPGSVAGVGTAVPDFQFSLEEPELREPYDEGAAETASGGPGSEATDDAELPQFFDLQWDKHVTEVLGAHEVATGDGARLAILDTGIDDEHPDLSNVNVDLSASAVGGEIAEHVGDVDDHGTHVAGIAAATGEVGVLGTAPDAELVSIRIFPEEGLATFSDVLLAMEYAAEVGADAANMSVGTPPFPPQANADQYRRIMEPVAQGVTRSGTLLVGSAGNSDADLQRGGRFTLPNSLAGVTSVSATGPNDLRAFYSNYGTNEIAVAAPGGGYETLEKTLEDDPDAVEWPFPTNLVLSTVPGGEYAWFAGTSMAAPQVTGIAGLVRSVAPDANAAQVERAVSAGADLVQGQGDPELGAGRVNAANAIEEAGDGGS